MRDGWHSSADFDWLYSAGVSWSLLAGVGNGEWHSYPPIPAGGGSIIAVG